MIFIEKRNLFLLDKTRNRSEDKLDYMQREINPPVKVQWLGPPWYRVACEPWFWRGHHCPGAFLSSALLRRVCPFLLLSLRMKRDSWEGNDFPEIPCLIFRNPEFPLLRTLPDSCKLSARPSLTESLLHTLALPLSFCLPTFPGVIVFSRDTIRT